MQKLSRRQLAIYAVDQLDSGKSLPHLAEQLGASLAATKRTGQLDLLIEDICYEMESRGIQAQARITSASNLTDELKQQIEGIIKKATGVASVSLAEDIDKEVIGGVLIETATRTWDKTLRRRLTEIREAF